MSDRKAFEKWAKGKLDLQHIGVCYGDDITDAAFSAWQAAQAQAGQPIAAVTGWYDGRCVIEPLDRALAIPVGTALYSQPQAQASDAEAEYGRGYYDGRKSNIDQVPEFWYEALEKITQEYEELFIYYKDEREKDGWDSPEYPQILLEVRELLKGFNPAPPAVVNKQLLEALVGLLKAARGGIKLDAPELSIGYIDAAIDAITAAQEQSK